MDFFHVVDGRRSVRLFKQAPVGNEQIQQILETANSAPSAGNLQAYEVVVVQNDSVKAALKAAALDQDALVQAPVVMAFLAHPERSAVKYGVRGAELYCVQDATVACAFAHLAATALGLGSVWVGAFYEEPVSEALATTPSWRPVALLAVGHPAESPQRRSRRMLPDIVRVIR